MKTYGFAIYGINCTRLWLMFLITQSLAVAAVGSEAVALSISCLKQEWLVGEPLVLQLNFKNKSQTNQFVETELQNGIGTVNYLISTDGTNFSDIGANVFHDPLGRTAIISSNESLYHEEILWFNTHNGKTLFSNTGDYFFRVDCRNQTSNILKIHVKKPTEEADEKWANAFQAREVLLAGTPGGQKSATAVKLLTDCVNLSSAYSPYAAFFLAQSEPDKTNALALYEKADVANFPLQGRVILEKARLNLELGDKAKANELFQRIAKRPTTFTSVCSRGIISASSPARCQIFPITARRCRRMTTGRWYL
jgi:tetratricopeptide (TPR) repeat protein